MNGMFITYNGTVTRKTNKDLVTNFAEHMFASVCDRYYDHVIRLRLHQLKINASLRSKYSLHLPVHPEPHSLIYFTTMGPKSKAELMRASNKLNAKH